MQSVGITLRCVVLVYVNDYKTFKNRDVRIKQEKLSQLLILFVCLLISEN